MRSTFASLTVPNYRVYITGSLLSNLGTWLQNTAQVWLVWVLTGSGTSIGIVVAATTLPSLLFSPLAGVWADRFDRRSWLGWMQLAMAIPSAALGVLAVTGSASIFAVYVLSFFFGTAHAFEAPVRQSFASELVPASLLANAVALNSASFNGARLVGPALAGWCLAALGAGEVAAGWVICLNAISYLAVMVSLRLINPELLTPAQRAGRGRGAVRAALRYVHRRPDLILLMTSVFALGVFGLNFQVIGALMVTEAYDRGASDYGLLGSLVAVGSFTGALLAARRRDARLRVVVVAALSFSVAQVLSGFAPSYWIYAAFMPVFGITILTTLTTANALIQLRSRSAMRGRVAALYLTVLLGSTTLGAPVLGWFAEVHDPRVAAVLSGLVTGIGVLAGTAWFMNRVRQPRSAHAA